MVLLSNELVVWAESDRWGQSINAREFLELVSHVIYIFIAVICLGIALSISQGA